MRTHKLNGCTYGKCLSCGKRVYSHIAHNCEKTGTVSPVVDSYGTEFDKTIASFATRDEQLAFILGTKLAFIYSRKVLNSE